MRSTHLLIIIMGLALIAASAAAQPAPIPGQQPNPDPMMTNLTGVGVSLQVAPKETSKLQFLPINEQAPMAEYTQVVGQDLTLEPKRTVKVHISSSSGRPVHIDQATLDVGGQTLTPVRATADGRDVTKKLTSRDDDIVGAKEYWIEYVPASEAQGARLQLVAATKQESRAVSLPENGTAQPRVIQAKKFYDYKLGSRKGTLLLDGQITPEEQLGKPSLKTEIKTAISKKPLPILAWVMDDGQYLSVAIDVAADNTVSDADDETILYVRGEGGLASFRAGDAPDEYGRRGATYTGAANFEHRVYEFRIPMDKLPTPVKGKLGLSAALTI